MKLLVLLLISISSLTSDLLAQDHSGHVSHNMLLLGTDEVFADHIVYKEPHNVQVVVKVLFDEVTKQAYLAARRDFPDEDFVFLLDPMAIDAIKDATLLSGKILRRTENSQTVVKAGVVLDQGQFTVLFFNKLPLSLATRVIQ